MENNQQIKTNTDVSELATRPIGRLLWEYSLPAVIGMVVMSLYNVIDRIFIGRGVGPEAIAGLAITFPVMNLSAAIGVLIGAGASDVTLPYARDFMLYLLPGMMVMNIMYSLNNVMRASGYPKAAMITMFIGAGCNVILAPIFIFVLNMGIKGAAIATDISMTVGMAFVLAHFCRKDSVLHFKRGIYRLDWKIIVSIIGIGAAPSIVNFCASAINTIINHALYTYGGDVAVGAVGIFSTYTSLLCMVVVGICQGIQPILGYNYGAGRYDRMKRAFWLSAAAGTLVTSIGACVSVFWPEVIARAFTVDPELINATCKGLRTATVSFWIVGFPIIATTLFQSIGMAGKSIFLSLIRQVIFLIPLLLILPEHFGLEGVWAAFPTSDAMCIITTVIMVIWQMRVLNKQTHPLKASFG